MALTLSPTHNSGSTAAGAASAAASLEDASAAASLAPEPQPQQQQQQQGDEICSNPFLDAFFAVDKDYSETITSEELSTYVSDSQFDTNFGEKWMKLFDEDNDGTITLEEYCNVLGLNSKQARVYRLKRLKAACLKERKLPGDTTCISASMPLEMQLDVIEIFRAATRHSKTERDIASFIKAQLDEQFGRLWHVVIVIGQYWASYSHEPDMAFFFKTDKFIVMLWRTPGI